MFQIGDRITICNPPIGPAIAAGTNGSYQSKISAGDTVIVWGSHFTFGGNQLIWTRAGSSSSPTIILNENDGQYFWDQSSGQINAILDPRITPGQWFVNVESSCLASSAAFPVTVN